MSITPCLKAGACRTKGRQARIDYPKCYAHYVTREYIGTGGHKPESAALRYTVKQLCEVGAVSYAKTSG